MMRAYAVATAITEAHLAELSNLPSNFSMPVHVDVLLDAIAARISGDHRKALLYSAIAVESFVFECLQLHYEQVLLKKDSRHRVVELPVAGGGVSRKDPVYDVLASGDAFSRLLHERPFYLFGRSLLIDEPDLYRRALQLYSTRNKIAHRGMPPSDEKYFALTVEDSTEGIQIAADVVRWFGDPRSYPTSLAMLKIPDDFTESSNKGDADSDAGQPGAEADFGSRRG